MKKLLLIKTTLICSIFISTAACGKKTTKTSTQKSESKIVQTKTSLEQDVSKPSSYDWIKNSNNFGIEEESTNKKTNKKAIVTAWTKVILSDNTVMFVNPNLFPKTANKIATNKELDKLTAAKFSAYLLEDVFNKSVSAKEIESPKPIGKFSVISTKSYPNIGVDFMIKIVKWEASDDCEQISWEMDYKTANDEGKIVRKLDGIISGFKTCTVPSTPSTSPSTT